MDQTTYLASLAALLVLFGILIWQTRADVAYERGERDDCEGRYEIVLERANKLEMEVERWRQAAMNAGVRISGGTNTIGGDLIGNDKLNESSKQ